MQNWNPSVTFEVEYGKHLERVARGEKLAQLRVGEIKQRPMRSKAAAALVALADRLSR